MTFGVCFTHLHRMNPQAFKTSSAGQPFFEVNLDLPREYLSSLLKVAHFDCNTYDPVKVQNLILIKYLISLFP